MMLNFTGENMSATHQWKYSGHLEQTTIFLPFLFWSNCLIFLEDLLNWNWNLNNEDGEEKTKELTRNKHSHIALLLELFLQIPANLNCLMSSEKGPFFSFLFFLQREWEWIPSKFCLNLKCTGIRFTIINCTNVYSHLNMFFFFYWTSPVVHGLLKSHPHL